MTTTKDPIDLLMVDNDIVIGSDLAFVYGIEAVTQLARVAVQMIKGEWFLDEDEGIPLFERSNVTAREALLGQHFDRTRALNAYRAALETVPNATITSLDVSFDGPARRLTVQWAITTNFGDVVDALVVGV